MNLLAKADQIYSKCVKEAVELSNSGIGLNGLSIAEYSNLLWDKEMNRIRQRLAPKYHELREVLTECKILKEKKENSLPTKWVLITLRPEDGACHPSKLLLDTEKLANKSLFTQGEWTIEQTGESPNEAGKGFHTHLLMECKSYVNVKDIITACNFIKYNCIIQIGRKTGVKFLRNQQDLEFCKNYIRGEKHNEEKETACAINLVWRKNNGFENLYSRTIKTSVSG